jgi:hypothetical protein
VQAIAAVCIGRPQEGQDVESSFFAIFTNISTFSSKVKKNSEKYEKILIFLGCQIRLIYPFLLSFLLSSEAITCDMPIFPICGLIIDNQ